MKSIGRRVENIETRLDETIVKVEKMEKLEEEVKLLREEVRGRPTSSTPKSQEEAGDTRARTTVWGGLQQLGSLKEITKWIQETLQELNLEISKEIYVKSDASVFKGLVFAKFSSQGVRDEVVEAMKKNLEAESSWVKPDKPIKQRASDSFLLGVKRVLVSWGFGKQQIKVDTEERCMKDGDTEIVKVTEKDGAMELEWSPAWKDWQAFMTEESVVELIAKFHSMMETAGKSTGKGKKGE